MSDLKVTLYSTHCPKCIVLGKKLQQKGIEFTEINDVNIMQKNGFLQAPMLEVDKEVMNFQKAIEWANRQ